MKCKFNLEIEGGSLSDMFALASLAQINVNADAETAPRPVRIVKDSSITKTNG